MSNTTRKKSFKNVLLGPPPVSAYVHVEQPVSFKNTNPRTEFMLACIGNQLDPNDHSYNQDVRNEWLSWNFNYVKDLGPATFLVLSFEHEMLERLLDKSNPDYKKLDNDMHWLARELDANVGFYVGHIESCQAHIENVYKKILIEKLNFYKDKRPTIFIIVGCYGHTLADQLNTNPQYKFFQENNVTFFGFEDFMHFYAGMIFSCKELFYKPVDFRCNYDGVEEDLKRLLAGGKTPNDFETFDKSNPLYQCAESKLERMFKVFVDELVKRKTTKHTKETLLKKFKPYIESGADRSLLNEDYTTIKESDGIPCTSLQQCGVPNPFNTKAKIAKEFNEKGELRDLFEVFEIYLQESTEESVDKFWEEIQGLEGRQRSIFLYSYQYQQLTILELILQKRFQSHKHHLFDIIMFILNKYGPFLDFVSNETGCSFLGKVMDSVMTHTEMYTIYRKVYSLVEKEKEKDREAVFFGVPEKKIAAPFLIYAQHFNYLVLEFYIEKFGKKLNTIEYYLKPHIRGNVLHRVMEYPISRKPDEREVQLKCIHALLANGMNPNQRFDYDDLALHKYVANSEGNYYTKKDFYKAKQHIEESGVLCKPLEVYVKLFFPLYDETLFSLFLRYGMTNDNEFFTKELAKWKGYLAKPKTLQEDMLVLKAYSEYIDDVKDYGNSNYYAYGGMPYRGYNNNSNYNNYSPPSRTPYEVARAQLTAAQLVILNSLEVYAQYYKFQGNNIQYSLDAYLLSLRHQPREIVTQTIKLYEEALRVRRAYGKHGSTFRKLRKTNNNTARKTIKNQLNLINARINLNANVEKLIEKLKENIKKPQLTKEQRDLFQQRYTTIVSQNIQSKDKYNVLKNIESKIDELLDTKKQFRQLTDEVTEFIKKPKFTKDEKAKFRKELVDITKGENTSIEEKTNKLNSLLNTLKEVYETR